MYEETPQHRPHRARAHAADALGGKWLREQKRSEREPVEMVDGRSEAHRAGNGKNCCAAHRESQLKRVEGGVLAKRRDTQLRKGRHAPRAGKPPARIAEHKQRHMQIASVKEAEAVVLNGIRLVKQALGAPRHERATPLAL